MHGKAVAPFWGAVAVLTLWMGAFGPGSSSAEAALLNLTQRFPDITSGFIDVHFDYSEATKTGTFVAAGYALSFDIDGKAPPDYAIGNGLDPSFLINLQLDEAGIPQSGSLVIRGFISGLVNGPPSVSLLTGNISQFGFLNLPDGERFEFLFSVTGGALSQYFGSQAGVILGAGAWQSTQKFTGTFTGDFANTGSGVSDTFFVPEPCTGTLMVSLIGGGLAARAFRRRRRR